MRSVLVLTLAITGCGFGKPSVKPAIIKTTLKPTMAQVSGRYVPTLKTANFIGSAGYSLTNVSIVLKEDGTFTFDNIPGCWSPFAKSADESDSGTGRWNVEQKDALNENRCCIELLFTTTKDIRSRDFNGSLLTEITLLNNSQPYSLYFPIEDAESDRSMVFEQTQSISP